MEPGAGFPKKTALSEFVAFERQANEAKPVQKILTESKALSEFFN